MRNTFFKILISFAALVSVVSCRDWLEVETNDRVLGSTLFATEDGYMSAGNGLYMELISPDTFNGALTYTMSDIMAQLYYMGSYYGPSNTYLPVSQFEDAEKQRYADAAWSSIYIILGNLNTLLNQLEEGLKDGVLRESAYNLYKGELYGLRAYLHFELYKLYGPIKKETPDMKTIPYADTHKLELKSLLPASEAVERIYEDLAMAEELLLEADPIVKEGPMAYETAGASNDLRFRPFRMNYYAVKAITARVALFVGDDAKAEEYALEVIKETQEDNSYFPFTERSMITSSEGKDLVLSSEVLFALYNTKRADDIYIPYFSGGDDLTSKLYMSPTGYEKLFAQDEVRTNFFIEETSAGGETGHFIQRYNAAPTANSSNPIDFRVYMPLVRISEMYKIVAEANQDDADVAYAHLNKVREQRNAANIAYADNRNLLEHIRLEIAREFIGEGQLLWYYKRNKTTRIPIFSPQHPYFSTQSVTADQYIFNIPINEDIDR